MIATLLLAALTLAPSPTEDATGSWQGPSRYAEGRAFVVQLDVQAPADGTTVPVWLLTPAAFELDGEPLGKRDGKATLELTPGARVNITIDLGPAIASSKRYKGQDFQLSLVKTLGASEPREIARFAAADRDVDFMSLPEEELSRYLVLMQTRQGEMLIEMWPDVAPNHVRNFLDLSHGGFYDGLIFHRVIPGFMIQGGDPTGTGTGAGPRRIKAEFSDRKHVPGVLSAARTPDPDSATSQFFIVHGPAPHLDGQYSAFGKVIDGFEAVERIVDQPRVRGSDTPAEPQNIISATVVRR